MNTMVKFWSFALVVVFGQNCCFAQDQDFQFLGLFQMQPAQTATVSTYVMPETTLGSQSTIGVNPLGIPSPLSVPAYQHTPQVPSFVYPANAFQGGSHQYSGYPQLPRTFQGFPSLGGQVPFTCPAVMQMLAAQNQLGFQPLNYKK